MKLSMPSQQKTSGHEGTSPCRCCPSAVQRGLIQALNNMWIYFTATDEIWPFPWYKTAGDHNGLKKEIVSKNTYWDLACMNNKFRDINNPRLWNQTCATGSPDTQSCSKVYSGYDTIYYKFTEHFKAKKNPHKNPPKPKKQLITFPSC